MPSTSDVIIAHISPRNTLPPTTWNMPPPIRWPSPVSVTMPTMMPAVEQAVATETMLRAASGSASRICFGETHVLFLKNGTSAAIAMPHSAERVIVKPDSMK